MHIYRDCKTAGLCCKQNLVVHRLSAGGGDLEVDVIGMVFEANRKTQTQRRWSLLSLLHPPRQRIFQAITMHSRITNLDLATEIRPEEQYSKWLLLYYDSL